MLFFRHFADKTKKPPKQLKQPWHYCAFNRLQQIKNKDK